MAVEDHPKYPEWRCALEAVLRAEERVKRAEEQKLPDRIVNQAKGELKLAQSRYVKICSELD